MTLFVDASALVAMIVPEEEGEALVARLVHDGAGLWSAMSGWETVSALRNSYRLTIEDARRELNDAVSGLRLHLVPVGADELQTALGAYQRYGKGSGHSARLNMGDCFAYACAKTNGAGLLYKGDDFARTDLA